MSIDPASLPTLPTDQDQDFAAIREANLLYMDKTRFIQRMLSAGSHVNFCARPRQLGKTLMVSTLECFFQGRKSLFKGLDIEEYMESDAFSEHLVLRFGMNNAHCKSDIEGFRQGIFDDVEFNAKRNGLCLRGDYPTNAFTRLLIDLHREKKGNIVLLVDGYDSQLVSTHDEKFQKEALACFRHFYNVIKAYDAEGYFEFVFITGVNEFTRYDMYSAMNYVADISPEYGYGQMFGYTDEELYNYFGGYISATAENMSITQEQLMERIRKCCDRFTFFDKKDMRDSVYNPASIHKFFRKNVSRNL
jgi:hypothetical protein